MIYAFGLSVLQVEFLRMACVSGKCTIVRKNALPGEIFDIEGDFAGGDIESVHLSKKLPPQSNTIAPDAEKRDGGSIHRNSVFVKTIVKQTTEGPEGSIAKLRMSLTLPVTHILGVGDQNKTLQNTWEIRLESEPYSELFFFNLWTTGDTS